MMHDVQVTLAHRLHQEDKITKSAAQERLGVALENLKEAARILGVEPDHRETLTKRLEELSKMMEQWEE